MNTGQMILSIGSMTLLSILVLNILRLIGEQEDVYDETRSRLEAFALTSSLIEEASQMPFDEVSWDSTNLTKTVSDFTFPSNLGMDAGESVYADFDDFDDFNNFIRVDSTLQSVYQLNCIVDYIAENNPDSASIVRTYYKRLTVTTMNQFTQDSVQLQYIHGYWYFN
ncbi:hypothetical protein ISS30_11105 [bacterium]|nr:hypothetical protein [FCB group bacterium]MBL7192226.1 hypothetical protein [bacterium]